MVTQSNTLKLSCRVCNKTENNPQVYNQPYTKPAAGDYTFCPNCGTLYQFVSSPGREDLILQGVTSTQKRLFSWKHGNTVQNSYFGNILNDILKSSEMRGSRTTRSEPKDTLSNLINGTFGKKMTSVESYQDVKKIRDLHPTFGEFLKDTIVKKGISIEFLCKETTISEKQMKELFSDKIYLYTIGLDNAVKLCRSLHLNFMDIAAPLQNTFYELQLKNIAEEILSDIIPQKHTPKAAFKDVEKEQRKTEEFVNTLKYVLDGK